MIIFSYVEQLAAGRSRYAYHSQLFKTELNLRRTSSQFEAQRRPRPGPDVGGSPHAFISPLPRPLPAVGCRHGTPACSRRLGTVASGQKLREKGAASGQGSHVATRLSAANLARPAGSFAAPHKAAACPRVVGPRAERAARQWQRQDRRPTVRGSVVAPDCPPRPTKHLMADGACLLGTGAVQNEHRCAFVPRGPTAPAAGLVAATYASMLYGAIMHSGCVVACSAVAGEQSSLIEVTQLPCSWLQNCQDNDVFHGSITFAHSIRRLAPVWWVHVVRVWGLSGCWGV